MLSHVEKFIPLFLGHLLDSQRYLKEASGEETFYILDGSQTLAVMKEDTLRWWNITGQGIEGRRDAESDSLRFYLKDHLGSTRAVVDNIGTVLETFDYYPGGLYMPQRSSTTGNTIEKFTGKERDESIGLDYFGARYYDPAIWRWTTFDPLADDPAQVDKSPYAYAWNNPVNITDPDGRCPSCVGAAVGGFLDIGFQMVIEGKSLSEVDLVSVGISMAAGATGV